MKLTSQFLRYGGKNRGALTCESYGEQSPKDEQSNLMHFQRVDCTAADRELASPCSLTHFKALYIATLEASRRKLTRISMHGPQ